MAEPDTTLELENFAFSGLEVPEKIPFGGKQALVTHQLVGGVRVVDSMGADHKDLVWSGWFLGEAAVDRARYIDNLRVVGAQLPLTWGEFSYTVVIDSFDPDYERSYQIPYTITCRIISDDTTGQTTLASPSVDDQVNDDLNGANDLASTIADPQLTGLMAAFSASLSNVASIAAAVTTTAATVASLAGAPRSLINGALVSLSAVTARVGVLLTAADTAVGAAQGFAGIVAGAQLGDNTAALNTQMSNMFQLNYSLQMRALCGRMNANLLQIDASELTVTVAGGNLFQIAQEQYGDPMAWTTIAEANDITDPFLTGQISTLVIPPTPDDTDGVLVV